MLTEHDKRLYQALTMVCEGAPLEDAAQAAGITVAELAAEIADEIVNGS
jgi:hypothetical protein